VWAEWKRVDPKDTLKVFEARKDFGFDTTVGLDDEEELQYDDKDNELENNPSRHCKQPCCSREECYK